MTDNVFISHAGADWPQVAAIAQQIGAAGLNPVVDREELELGDSFIGFMERSLRSANYCLLLWSAAAARSPWVRAEWEAAFHRTVTESQRFLVVGCLDTHPVPELLRPRLRVNLFPDPLAGIDQLITLWNGDREAERVSRRPVCAPRCEPVEDLQGTAVYVSSELFGRTIPWRVTPELPAAVATEQIVTALGLPRRIDHEGRVGVAFNYRLALRDRPLAPDESLGTQGLNEHDLLWILTEAVPFAATDTVSGELGRGTFRDLSVAPPWAAAAIANRIRALGLE